MTLHPHDHTSDFSSDAFQENLYGHYRRYHEETPVFQSAEGVVYLTRYHDCVQLLSGDQFKRLPQSGGASPFSLVERDATPLEEMISQWMIFMEPPRHDVIRKAFSNPFTARAIDQLKPFLHRQARQLLDELPSDGDIEFLGGFAFPFPVMVIAAILGVPESDMELFRTWSAALTEALDTGRDEDIRKGSEVGVLLKQYFTELMLASNSLPAGSLMCAIRDGEVTDLTPDEILYNCILLLWAGHETTKNLIANGIKILAERPAEFARLIQHPELIERAVEEMLRFESPVQKISRWTYEDARFGDYLVPRGTLVTALLGAANRDSTMFDMPDIFDLQREKNRHLAFGTGIHHCLGALLARVEAKVAFSELLPRLGGLAPVSHQWRTYSAFRSLESLTVRVTTPC